jgi:hypothetical protein
MRGCAEIHLTATSFFVVVEWPCSSLGKPSCRVQEIATHAGRRCRLDHETLRLQPRSRESPAQFLPTPRRNVVGRRQRADVLPCPGPPAGARYERRHQSSKSAKALLNVARHGTARIQESERGWFDADRLEVGTYETSQLPPRCHLPTADCHLATAGFRLPTATSRLPTADHQIRLPTTKSRLPCHLTTTDCHLATPSRHVCST